jgi:hypothetical protein
VIRTTEPPRCGGAHDRGLWSVWDTTQPREGRPTAAISRSADRPRISSPSPHARQCQWIASECLAGVVVALSRSAPGQLRHRGPSTSVVGLVRREVGFGTTSPPPTEVDGKRRRRSHGHSSIRIGAGRSNQVVAVRRRIRGCRSRSVQLIGHQDFRRAVTGAGRVVVGPVANVVGGRTAARAACTQQWNISNRNGCDRMTGRAHLALAESGLSDAPSAAKKCRRPLIDAREK